MTLKCWVLINSLQVWYYLHTPLDYLGMLIACCMWVFICYRSISVCVNHIQLPANAAIISSGKTSHVLWIDVTLFTIIYCCSYFILETKQHHSHLMTLLIRQNALNALMGGTFTAHWSGQCSKLIILWLLWQWMRILKFLTSRLRRTNTT